MRDGWACWDNNFWLQLEKYGELAMVEKFIFFPVASMCLFFFEIYKRGL